MQLPGALHRSAGRFHGAMQAAVTATIVTTAPSSIIDPARADNGNSKTEVTMHSGHAHDANNTRTHGRPGSADGSMNVPHQPVMGEMVEYTTIDGVAVRGYLSRPTDVGKTGPAIVMVHEWWGINDNIRNMADRYAGEGYVVLAVDLFDGHVATTVDAATRLYQTGMAEIGKGERNVAAAVNYLRSHGASSVGSMGYCFGGHWALRTGLAAGSAVNAVVIYYGAPITDPVKLAHLKAPVLGLFAARDASIPIDHVHAMEREIGKLGLPITIHVYPGVDHAFVNPSNKTFDGPSAEDAFDRTLAFFKANLKQLPG